MTSSETCRDRRQHRRYDIDSGGFAMIRSGDTEVLGSIKDISAGGLSLSHIDDCNEIAEHSSLAINLVSEKLYAEKIPGKSIWSSKEEDGFTTSRVNMRCCGIAFEQLNSEMRGSAQRIHNFSQRQTTKNKGGCPMEPAFSFPLLQLTSRFLDRYTSHTPAQAAGCAETSRHKGCTRTYFLFF